jgi:hypothetical protein
MGISVRAAVAAFRTVHVHRRAWAVADPDPDLQAHRECTGLGSCLVLANLPHHADIGCDHTTLRIRTFCRQGRCAKDQYEHYLFSLLALCRNHTYRHPYPYPDPWAGDLSAEPAETLTSRGHLFERMHRADRSIGLAVREVVPVILALRRSLTSWLVDQSFREAEIENPNI